MKRMDDSSVKHAFITACLLLLALFLPASLSGEEGLLAHWKLETDGHDYSGNGHFAFNHGVQFDGSGSALFDGIDDHLEVPARGSLQLRRSDFTIAAWVYTEKDLDDVLGDVISWYDPATANGFTLSLMNYAGVTSAQSNWRNVLFGIDADQLSPAWVDRGRPGNNHHVKSLVVFDGDLYASTWEPEAGAAGHVYRYAGGRNWIDCGAPSPANSITGLAVYQGHLYAGSELYSGAGSSLPVSPNEEHGGHVYRYEGRGRWTDCGKISDVRSISGLAVFDGALYAGTGTTGAWRDTPRTRGMYRYDGEGNWLSCGCPGLRVVHLGVHNGSLLGMSYDAGGFFRYEGGTDWTRLGPLPDTTQAYSMAVYQGKVHVGTWPTGSVFRFDGPQQWSHQGRLGKEKEVMGMAVYNGKLYAGTLPMADVYRYEGNGRWVTTGQLDNTPGVRYRRAWSMAVFQGKLFCGVLPSGHVHSLEAGKCVTLDRALPAGWHHLAAMRAGDRLLLYVDGRKVATSSQLDPALFDLAHDSPLRIGFGQHDYFNGRMKDLRIYDRALDPRELKQLGR
jgi:hypothetical protein